MNTNKRQRFNKSWPVWVVAFILVAMITASGFRERWSGIGNFVFKIKVTNQETSRPIDGALVSVELSGDRGCVSDAKTFHTDNIGVATIVLRCPVDGESFLFGLGDTENLQTPIVHVEVSKQGYLNGTVLHEFDTSIRDVDIKNSRSELEIRLTPTHYSKDIPHER